MKKGDLALYYHSGDERQVVGIARVIKEAYSDHTADDPRWIMVDVEPMKPVKNPIPLKLLKEIPELKNTKIIKQPRLSVSPLTKKEYDLILTLS